MSDVKAAAERLRRLVWPAKAGNIEDIGLVLGAYFRDHPADDSIGIDEAWLRSVGFSALWDVEKEFRLPTAPDAHLALFCPSKSEGYACCLGGPSSYAPLPDIKTRGDVRLLAKALGIELGETK